MELSEESGAGTWGGSREGNFEARGRLRSCNKSEGEERRIELVTPLEAKLGIAS